MIKLKLLSHFLHVVILKVLLISDYKLWWLNIRIVSDTSIDEFVFSSFEPLKDLLADMLFSVDEAIFVSVVIEVNLSVLIVNLNQFFPMIGVFGTLIMLNSFELVRESSSEEKFISSKLEEGSNFFNYQPFIVLIDG